MINQSFIHTGNDYLPLQISQYIRKPLPLPINNILQILNKNFPPQLQKQQTYVKVIDFNNQLIYEQFEDVIDSVMTPISSSFIENGLTDDSVYPMIYNGMKKHLGKAKLYEYYMDSLQTYMEYRRKSGLEVNQSHIRDNRQKSGILIKDSLTYLAQKHLQYYGLEPQFPFYINIIQKRWIQKKSKKFQMVPTLMRLGTQNQTPHQQMVQNTNLQIDDPQSPSLSSPPLSSQYRQPQFYDKNMINHIYTIMTKNYNQLIGKDTYRAKAYQVLKKHISDIRISQKNARFYHLQQEVVKQLSKAQVGFSPSVQGESNIYHEKQSWMIVLVYIYKYMQNNYDSYRRRKLKSICNSLNNSQIDRMQNWIKYLQNERQQLKTLQTNQVFMSKASSVLFDVYKERANFLKGQFQSNKDQLPDFKLINLSQKKLQRKKTVNIWISGFLSQNMDKKSHWIKLTGLLKGKQIYAVQWSSDCITNLIKFIGKACIQILTADSMKQQLNKKFHENPFLPAMKVANMLGRYLAQIIVKLFPTQFVNLTGYSLGSEMIKSCVQRLVQLGKQSILCSVYFLGGVSDINQLQQIVRKATYPISIFNCFTGNDSVLKNILSLCLPKAKPIGLYELTLVQGHQIINIDCSKQISGHLSYMSQYDTIGKLVGMDKD